MRDPVIESSLLAINDETSKLHNHGLKASLRGDFTSAQNAFADAREALVSTKPTIDMQVQLSRIVRDEGYTFARKAVSEGDISLLETAESRVVESLSLMNAGNLNKLEFLDPGDPEQKAREINAEQAATLSALGRVATARTALNGSLVETDAYLESHKYAVLGSNGYYRVSNSVNAARHERIYGQPVKVARWLGRAASGLMWTAVKDRKNLRRAVLTTGDRVLHLQSKKSAIRSVLNRP